MTRRQKYWLQALAYYPQYAFPLGLIRPLWLGSLVLLFVVLVNCSQILIIKGILFPVSYYEERKRELEALAKEY